MWAEKLCAKIQIKFNIFLLRAAAVTAPCFHVIVNLQNHLGSEQNREQKN